MANRACVVIPHYNHAGTIGSVLQALKNFDIPVIVVDDGSTLESLLALRVSCSEFGADLLERQPNEGKGAAFIHAMHEAGTRGYTHAVQVDADGQHDINKMPLMLRASEENPGNIISGAPVFDDSVPASRLHGRKLTTFCVMLETWSKSIQDAMCGFRVYPVQVFNQIASEEFISRRMGFDTDILVRSVWRGQGVSFVPVAVHYPIDGVSHFRLFADNVGISLMHMRLLSGMLWRLPRLLWRRIRKNPAQSPA
jgi:glycosyltransferase involved in cell wall biosynthesis